MTYLTEDRRHNREMHGRHGSPLYNTRSMMNQRCYNTKNPAYEQYGARGITVCAEWRESFESFEFYVAQLPHFGEKGYTLDRIDNDGNYEPGNVRWATPKEQSRNMRSNRLLTHNGKTLTVRGWEEELGMRRDLLWERFHRGWSVERALTEPVGKQGTKRS